MKKLISRAFNIHEGEHGRVFLSWLIFLLIMSGIIIGRNARDSIFLSNVDIKWLPYMYVLNAVFVVLVSVVYTSFVDRVDRTLFLVVSLALYAGVAFLTRMLLMAKLQWFYSACYVIVQIMWLVGLMQFWTFMGDVFDARESKRLFPVVGSGGLMGMIVAGFGAKYVVKAIGTDNLFLVWAGMLVGCIFLVLALSRAVSKTRKVKPKAAKPAQKKSQIQEFKDGLAYIKEVQLLKTLILINLGLWVVFTIVDYEFSVKMKEAYPIKDDLTAFLGIFRALAGVLCFVVQFGVLSRLLNRLGVGRVIAIHPAYMVFGTAFLTAKLGYLSAVVSKFGDHVMLYTVQDSSYQMMYNPIPPDKRGRARGFVEGYIKPISMGIAGVILILSASLLTPTITCAISFAFALLWAYASLRANRDYVKALTDNLTHDDARVRSEALKHLPRLDDAKNLNVLKQVLKSDNQEMIIFALGLIEDMKAAEAIPNVRELLKSEVNEIQAAAVTTLAALNDRESLENIEALLQDDGPAVRRAALRALSQFGDDNAVTLIEPLLEDPKKKVRSEAVAALIKAGGLDGILHAAEILKKMLEAKTAKKRIRGIEILGNIRVRHFTPSLLPMMADSDISIRRAAVRAVSRLKDARAVDALIQSLDDPRLAHDAERGLEGLDKKALPGLHAAVAGHPAPAVRRRALRILRKSKELETVPVVLAALEDPLPEVRGEAIHVVTHLKLGPEQLEKVQKNVAEFLKKEVLFIYHLRHSGAALKSRIKSEINSIFFDMLKDLEKQSLDRVFSALSMLLDKNAVRGIWGKLKSEDPALMPIALEALDNIGRRELTANVSALFEDRNPEDTIKHAETIISKQDVSPAANLQKFAGDSVSWVRGCAAVAIGDAASELPQLTATLETLASDSDAFVRETAEWVLRRSKNETDEVRHVLLTMEKILFLKTVHIFAGMTGEELHALAEIVEEVEVKGGETIFSEGEPGEEMYIIVNGSVQVLHGEGAAQTLLATLGEREVLGEMSILDDEPRSATARTSEDTVMLKIRRDDFRELIGEEPEVAFGVFRVFTRRIRRANVETEQAATPIQGAV